MKAMKEIKKNELNENERDEGTGDERPSGGNDLEDRVPMLRCTDRPPVESALHETNERTNERNTEINKERKIQNENVSRSRCSSSAHD